MVSIGVCSLMDEDFSQAGGGGPPRRTSSIGQLMLAANECMEIASTIAVMGGEEDEEDQGIRQGLLLAQQPSQD